MVKFTFDISQPSKRFDAIERRAQQFGPILKRWGGYLRASALKRAEAADGWAPLAESTRKKYEQTRTSSVTSAGNVRKSYAGNLEGYLKKEEKKGSTTASADLAELRRLRAGGKVERGEGGRKAAAWTGSKAVDRLRKRLARAEDQRAKGRKAKVGGDRRKSEKHKMLGVVARSIVFRTEGTGVSDMSRVPWSGAHNEGGSVGNGATVPARPFLFISSDDRRTLAQIALEHMLG